MFSATWPNVHLSSLEFCGVHLRIIAEEMLKIFMIDMAWKKIIYNYSQISQRARNRQTYYGHSTPNHVLNRSILFLQKRISVDNTWSKKSKKRCSQEFGKSDVLFITTVYIRIYFLQPFWQWVCYRKINELGIYIHELHSIMWIRYDRIGKVYAWQRSFGPINAWLIMFRTKNLFWLENHVKWLSQYSPYLQRESTL